MAYRRGILHLMCACFPVWLIERGYYIYSALNDSKIGGLVTGAKWLGDVQIVGKALAFSKRSDSGERCEVKKAQRDVKRKIRGGGVGVSCSLSCSPSFFFPALRLRAALHCLDASNRLSKILISMPDIARFVCYSFNWSLRGGSRKNKIWSINLAKSSLTPCYISRLEQTVRL